ncbi:MAG: DUF1049 domain-containing protein [Actinobacteria bacterium]|nr:DUF1049 domain-containing protein [Actinomycetota bacterium]MBU1493605.1 DUF1049 domain-containing protein [Actinomycetota bacterium]MBU1866274.1 DUF1049 domain-containing protein [Actinomycetota bacterium]
MSDRESDIESPEETGPAPEAPTPDVAGSEQPAVSAPPRPEPAKMEARRVFVGTGVFWGLVIAVLLAAAVIILAAQNTQQVTVEFLSFEIDTSLIVVLLAALLVGVVLDEIVGWVYRARRRRTLTDREELKHLRADR